MEKKSSKVAVLLIDMQEFFLQRIEQKAHKPLIDNQIKVIRYCAAHKIPLVVLEYEGVGRGKTIPKLQSEIKKVSTVAVIRKPHNSGFRDTNLDLVLKEWRIKKVVLMGINGSGCVQDTAIGALGRKYSVATASEVIASSSERDRNLATSRRWFAANARFFESIEELLAHIKNSV
jgi:nicotinamidase-related amidase